MELLRVLKDRKIIFFSLLLLLATAGIYYYDQMKTINSKTENLRYMDETELENMEEYLPYENRQAEYAAAYQDEIRNIIQSADAIAGISIFQDENSFSNKNLKKTKSAYERIASVEPENGNYEAVEKVISCDWIGYFIFLFAFILIWTFSEEQKTGLKRIVYAAPGGRGRRAVKQLGTLAVLVSFFTIIAYVCIFAESVHIYGEAGSFAASVQSMILMGKFTYPVTVWEYLAIFLMLRMVCAIAASFFAWMFLSLFRNRIFGLAAVIMVYGVEAVSCFKLEDTSAWSFLKYLNVFGLLNPKEILYEYRNFNLASTPVNCLAAVTALAILTVGISMIVIFWIVEKRKPVYSLNVLEKGLESLVGKIQDRFHRILAHLSLTGYEIYKLLIVNKGMVFLAVWLCVVIMQLDFTKVNFVGKSALLNEIYREYEGPIDGRLDAYISDQEIRIREIESEYEKKLQEYENGDISESEYASALQVYSSYTTLIDCMDEIKEQISYVTKMDEERGIEAWIVYEKPFRILWTGNGIYEGQGYGNQEFTAMANLFLMIFLLFPIFSNDKITGIQPVIRCTANGRKKLFRKRVAITYAVCLLICGISTGLKLCEVNRNYPVRCLAAPVQSLRFMEAFPLKISIGCFMVLLLLLQTFVLFMLALLVLEIMYQLPGTKGLAVVLVILTVPQLAYMLGVSWGWFLSAAQPLIYVEILDKYGFGISMIAVLLVGIAGVTCYRKLKNQWCGKRRGYETGN
jgi:hypothetical protein